jgi:hypothetical protein
MGVLLTIDDTPSHAAIRMLEVCAKANIIVLTHLLQPFGVSWGRWFKWTVSE